MNQNNVADLSLFKEIRELITAARNAVVRNVNAVQVITNANALIISTIGNLISFYEIKYMLSFSANAGNPVTL